MNGYFDRRAIKARAKENLKKCYWLAFGVAAIIGSLLGEISIGNFSFDLPTNTVESSTSVEPVASELTIIIMGLVLFVLGIVIAVSVVKAYFLDGVLTVGRANFFLSATRETAQFTDAFSGFKKSYRNICKVMFVRTIKLFLWGLFLLVPCLLVMVVALVAGQTNDMAMAAVAVLCLLLIPFALIPSIVKGYEYSMIPYLLAEFPDMTTSQAFAASRELTEGRKGDLFVLDLSFIGWTLLGLLCFGVGVFFLEPYIQASKAQAYIEVCQLKYPPAPVEPTGEA